MLPGSERGDPIDIGGGVQIRYTRFEHYDRVGLTEYHVCGGRNCPMRGPTGEPGMCGGGVLFDLPGIRDRFPDRALWTVHRMEPLTITPSLACGCDGCPHHGFITDGRWVEA